MLYFLLFCFPTLPKMYYNISTIPQSWYIRFLFTATLVSSILIEDKFEVYDFIVVGAGTAGCVVASRLSENGKYSVLLIENGGFPHANLNVPALMYKHRTPEFIKTYKITPRRNTDQQDEITNYITGHVLGGGSAINGMQFDRGHPMDYDNWANLTGDQSWNYANMLQHFKRIENYNGRFLLSHQHGSTGPIPVSGPHYTPGFKRWLRAGQELGYAVVDPNGHPMESFAPIEFSQRFGRRVSSYAGYIHPILTSRPNLKLETFANVKRILFQRGHLNQTRAVGVAYVKSSAIVTVRAKKEVIICAGVIGSPTLLLKSGIGPKQTLKQAGVTLIKDLPVGKNLHDQVGLEMDFFISNKSEVFDAGRDLNRKTWRYYNKFGDGPYASPHGQHAQAFLTSSGVSVWPDLQIVLVSSPGPQLNNETGLHALREGETAVHCKTNLGRPRSRGGITLNNTDIDAGPLINFRLFENPRDEVVLVEAIKVTLKIFESTRAYKEIGARYNPIPWPACGYLSFRSEKYWRCLVREKANIVLHAAGTCKMGSSNSPSTVVDTKLQVVGVQGLRVVDASVMPVVVNANTMAAVYAIAEKASVAILKNWEDGNGT